MRSSNLFINVLIIVLAIFSSCSLIKFPKKKEKLQVKVDGLNSQDYLDHLGFFENLYFSSLDVKEIPIPLETQNYLSSIILNIIKVNELFFKEVPEKVTVKIIDDIRPFHFSLPGHRYYLSAGLINKYLTNEGILFSILSYEAVRSEKNIYYKHIIIPVGYLTSERLLSLLRLSTSEKEIVHQWAYYLLKRAQLSPEMYLTWIQVQNRNSLDFSLMYTDTSTISREEALFKSFLISNSNQIKIMDDQNNRPVFYQFIEYVKAHTIPKNKKFSLMKEVKSETRN